MASLYRRLPRLRHGGNGGDLDLDRDGDPDLILSTPDGFAYQLDTDGKFASAVPFGATATGPGTSVAVGDTDGDGDPDVYGMVGLGHRSNPDDFIWLNNSVSFLTSVRVPSADGLANEVTASVPRANRRAAFLALDGFGRADDPIGPGHSSDSAAPQRPDPATAHCSLKHPQTPDEDEKGLEPVRARLHSPVKSARRCQPAQSPTLVS